MSASINPDIITDGLVLCLDDKNLMTNNNWKDILIESQYSGSTHASASWANDISEITICLFLQKIGNDTEYARHPFNKWNDGTSNASFVLYHFHNYLGTSPNNEGLFQWLGTSASWRGISDSTKLSLNEYAFICLQWKSALGGQLWKNNVKVGSRQGGGGGNLGIGGSGGINLVSPLTGDNYTKIFSAFIYNRELTDNEILQNYKALKGRFGL
jgi:hypothetical protein